jgi:hypothetical protein
VFFISFAVIGWQLGLMRCLLISRYHHFSFLVISCALLGFGAGGTVLSLAGSRLEGRVHPLFRWGLICFALSIPLCFRIGELLPLNVYFPPITLASTLGWWLLFWLIHLAPFLLAGILIGLALIAGKANVHIIYGSNLAGSAAGALGGILLMKWVPPNGLGIPFALCALASGLFLIRRPSEKRGGLYGALIVIAAIFLVATQLVGADRVFPLRIDQYKALAYVQRLVEQGSAQRKVCYFGPRGRIDLFSSPHFHTLLSLGTAGALPPMDALLRDGFQAGALPMIKGVEEARFLLQSLAGLPYRLLTPDRVLILGEDGAIYLWLARLSPARSIVLVQPDENIVRVLREHPSRILDDPRIRVVTAEARAFLDRTDERFDIIHLAALEGFAPGSGGIGGLREDYLATVEGFGQCLNALTPAGLASVLRGIQDPPRDNIKIAATWIEALERRGMNEPGKCLLMARDELGFLTLAGRSPVHPDVAERFASAARTMSLEPEWFPGVDPDRTNRVHVLPGPAGSNISWHHSALDRLLSQDREQFYENWMWDVRPALDDRPFFHDFFRWRSLSKLRAVFGPLWPARAEMGFLVLILAAVWTTVVAALTLPAPLILCPRGEGTDNAVSIFAVTAYFGALGAGFMFIEMSFIQIFTRFLGDPIPAAALVLGGILFFAGVGSMVQPRITGKLPGGIVGVTIMVAALVITISRLFPCILEDAGMLPDAWKVVVGLVIIAPLAMLMGNPFPWGLSMLHKRASQVIPLAWAVNGFVSVVSASVAVILAMVYGFRILLGLAAVLYLCAGVLSLVLAGRRG